MFKLIIGFAVLLFAFGVRGQDYNGFEMTQPIGTIHVDSADFSLASDSIDTTHYKSVPWVCKGYMAHPKCDTGLVLEINFLKDAPTVWTVVSAPPGIMMGAIFRRIRMRNTTVPLGGVHGLVLFPRWPK